MWSAIIGRSAQQLRWKITRPAPIITQPTPVGPTRKHTGMDPIIGIDLGTTNSAAAWLADDGPHLIPNAVGGTLTPSVVGLDPDGKLVVGAAAKELQVLHPERCATLFKRHMGSDWTAELPG